MNFQYGSKPVLIHWILISFEAILERIFLVLPKNKNRNRMVAYKEVNIQCQHNREGRDIGLIITLVSKVFFFVGLKTYWIFIGCFITLSVQSFQRLILIYRRGSFVYQVSTSIYRSLSYPFRSMSNKASLPAKLGNTSVWMQYITKLLNQ